MLCKCIYIYIFIYKDCYSAFKATHQAIFEVKLTYNNNCTVLTLLVFVLETNISDLLPTGVRHCDQNFIA